MKFPLNRASIILCSIAVSCGLIGSATAQSWQPVGKTIVATEGSACDSAKASVGFTADRSTLLTCQGNKWSRTSGSTASNVVTSVTYTASQTIPVAANRNVTLYGKGAVATITTTYPLVQCSADMNLMEPGGNQVPVAFTINVPSTVSYPGEPINVSISWTGGYDNAGGTANYINAGSANLGNFPWDAAYPRYLAYVTGGTVSGTRFGAPYVFDIEWIYCQCRIGTPISTPSGGGAATAILNGQQVTFPGNSSGGAVVPTSYVINSGSATSLNLTIPVGASINVTF